MVAIRLYSKTGDYLGEVEATKAVAESKLGAIHEPSGSHEVMVKIGRASPKALRYHPRSLHGQGMQGGFLQALLPILAEAAIPLLTDLASGLIGNVVGNLTGGQKKGRVRGRKGEWKDDWPPPLDNQCPQKHGS